MKKVLISTLRLFRRMRLLKPFTTIQVSRSSMKFSLTRKSLLKKSKKNVKLLHWLPPNKNKKMKNK
jgi:hypothetical protein